MKKIVCLIMLLAFGFVLTACDEKFDVTVLDGVWNEEFADSKNGVELNKLEGAKLFYDGEYVDFSTQLNKRKDVKYEFNTSNAFRFVNTPDEYAITIPSKNVVVDYSLSGYRVQLSFDESVLTVSHETKSPYGGNASGWHTYLNEWVIRYIDNPDYLDDNNLSYTRDKIVSTTILSNYEIILYSIVINDNKEIDKPYYNIGIVRHVKKYNDFHLFVMKSKNDQSKTFDKIIESFDKVTKFGAAENHVGQYEVKENENWSAETKAYYDKLNKTSTFEFGFFTYSLNDDGNLDTRNYLIEKVSKEEERLANLTGYETTILPTYSHIAWGDTPHYFCTELISSLAGGNGFDEKPVIQYTYQFTNNNNNVNINNTTANYTPMFDILRGEYDEYFKEIALGVKAYGKPVLFRLNNEMNTDWTSYCGLITLLDPDIFQKTWIRLYNIFEEMGVDNCIWIFNPIAETCPYSNWGEDLCYMPGTDYVQALGITRYEMLNNRDTAVGFKDGYTRLYEKNKDYWMNYPWIVSEFGCASGGEMLEDRKTMTELYRNQDMQAEWVTEMFSCLSDRKNNEFCSKITAAVWFNCNDYITVYDEEGNATTYIMNSLHLDSSLTTTFEAFREGLKKFR